MLESFALHLSAYIAIVVAAQAARLVGRKH